MGPRFTVKADEAHEGTYLVVDATGEHPDRSFDGAMGKMRAEEYARVLNDDGGVE